MQVLSFAEKLSDQKGHTVTYKAINQADHFFRDNLTELEDIILDYIQEELRNEEKSKKTTQQQNLNKATVFKDSKNTIFLD